MGRETDDWDGGWDNAGDDGQLRGDWMLGREGDSHPVYPGRDVDGRFNDALGLRDLSDEES